MISYIHRSWFIALLWCKPVLHTVGVYMKTQLVSRPRSSTDRTLPSTTSSKFRSIHSDPRALSCRTG
jgi:hypothetical protein